MTSEVLPDVLAYLEEHAADLAATVSSLVRVPSVSGSPAEQAIQHSLADELGRLGVETDHWEIPLAETLSAEHFPGSEVVREGAWGLVGRLPGSDRGLSLMLNAHVDVVPPGDPAAWSVSDPFSGLVGGGMVYGRGACDMKGGLAAALWVLRAFVVCDAPLRGNLLLACVPGEEDGGLGTFAMLDRGWRADACIIPEPTSLGLVPACAGALTFRLRVSGAAAHASRRTAGVSALERFWPVFAELRALEARRNRHADGLFDRWDVAYPIEVGTVRAGDWSSSVPDLLLAEGRIGVALGEGGR